MNCLEQIGCLIEDKLGGIEQNFSKKIPEEILNTKNLLQGYRNDYLACLQQVVAALLPILDLCSAYEIAPLIISDVDNFVDNSVEPFREK